MEILLIYLHRPMNSFVTQVMRIWELSLVSSYFPLKMLTANISETLQNRSLFSQNMVQVPNKQKMDHYLHGLVDASEEHDAPIFMAGGCGFFENVPTFYPTTRHHIPVGRNLHSGYMCEPQTSQPLFSHVHAHIQYQRLHLSTPVSSLQSLLNLSYFIFIVIYHKLRNHRSSL